MSRRRAPGRMERKRRSREPTACTRKASAASICRAMATLCACESGAN